ncbi:MULTISPECIES: hypothetical protein [unclassified Bradyrhizobium]|uniref:hypothetical protein n=1 Tax=unclassified Bradyrhizobium TaxID=2631580 RepID=UPI0015CB20AD|nr:MULTISPECIES: hypothetical protein [unclassified Bradyrhizobium]MBB4256104.1 hypothetical protein [Bradyrhizobium sp. CIR3A]NYG48272.1 hypothetical protein [Bradyrhizobium sp. IAR9]
MAAPHVKNMIGLLDAERIHHAQVLAPGFAGHDESNEPAQQAVSIPSVLGNKVRTTHHRLRDSATRSKCLALKSALNPGIWLAENERPIAVSEM